MSGFWAGDAIAQSLDNAQLQRALNQQKENYNELAADNAANLAEKQALREALRKFDKNHPLLTDAGLQERIKNAGIRAMSIADDWAACREAGASFKY